MKVLIISDGPHISTAYGKITKYVGRALHGAGYDVSFGVNTYHGAPAQYVDGDFTAPMYSAITAYRGNNTIIKHMIKQANPDVTIFIRDAVGLSLNLDSGISLADYKGKIKRISYIPIMHTTMVPDITQSLLASSDVIVPFTNAGRDVMMDSGVPYNMISDTIPPGYDETIYKPAKKRGKEFDTDANVFGFIGLLNNTRKSLVTLMKSFGKYLMDDPTAMLYLHYSQASAYNIPVLAQIFGVRGHIMMPKTYLHDIGIPERDMASIYSSLTACVSASGKEGFNLPFLEAMACGTPAVGLNLPFYDWSNQIIGVEAVDGVDDGTATSYACDPDMFARGMHASLKHKIDTDALKGFEWKEVGKKWVKLLEKV